MHHDIQPTQTNDIRLPSLRAILGSATGFGLFIFFAIVAAWGISFATFGIPGLYIPAVAAVPVIWIALLAITRG